MPPDGPILGLLLCEGRNGAIGEYALRDFAKPIGVSTYRVTRELPPPLQKDLPSIEDLHGVVEKLRGDFEAARSAAYQSVTLSLDSVALVIGSLVSSSAWLHAQVSCRPISNAPS